MRVPILMAILALGCLGMSKKPQISVRFHTETNKQDSDTFSMPVKLKNIQRSTYVNRVPDLSERNIQSIYPFPAADGSWGCVFMLDPNGRLRLETISTEHRGEALIIFVATPNGMHQVTDMIIDRPVTDGVISVPSGLSQIEVAVLRQRFPVLGEGKTKKKPTKKKKFDPEDWSGNPDVEPAPAPNAAEPPPTPTKGEPLPRVAD